MEAIWLQNIPEKVTNSSNIDLVGYIKYSLSAVYSKYKYNYKEDAEEFLSPLCMTR